MALTGIEIYKLLPKTNCKDCGQPTCLAFAMQLAMKKASLDQCPHASEQAKQALESAAAPPIRKVTVGAGDAACAVGGETVMYRHEDKFYNPTGIAVVIDDTISEDELKNRFGDASKFTFERVGQEMKLNAVAIQNASGDAAKFAFVAAWIAANTNLVPILSSTDAAALKEAASKCTGKKPLLLLDDVLLELDSSKREKFIKELPACEQAFFTFLPDEQFRKYSRDDTLIYRVADGVFTLEKSR